MAPPRASSKKKPTRQPSLLKKPVIEIRGKIGKPQKSKKRKSKQITTSTVDFYETFVERQTQQGRPEVTTANAPPKSLDQEIPKKLKQLIRFKEKEVYQANLSKRKRNALKNDEWKKQFQEDGVEENAAPRPNFTRRPGEHEKAFRARVEAESNELVQIAKFENDNECKIVNKSGNLEIVNKVRRKQIKNREHREKLKAKKQKRVEDDNYMDFSDFKDEVKFNERTDRPPEFSAKPRKAKEHDKGAKLSSLKFMETLKNSSMSKPAPVKSLIAQERLQEERQRAIDMYRSMKARKKNNSIT